MKVKNISLGKILSLTILVGMVFLPFISIENKSKFSLMGEIFLMAFFAYFFSSLGKRKVLGLLIPILFYSFLVFYLVYGASLTNNKEVGKDLLWIIKDNYYLLSLILIFSILEGIISRIFGTYFSLSLSILGIFIYILLEKTSQLGRLAPYKELILYFSIFIAFTILGFKKKIGGPFYIISILLIGLELFFYIKEGAFLGFFISPLILVFLIFEEDKNFSKKDFFTYLIFAIVLIFPIVKSLLNHFLIIKALALTISSLIISFFFAVIFSEAKVKLLDGLFLGLI